jgi:outer membrane protein assembly factor BamB
MKKIIYLTLILTILLCCVHKQEEVERIIEDGVEVIINHIEPYQIKGEPTTFTIEEDFVIDSERDDIAEIGLTYIDSFGVDSEGNIYFLNNKNPEKIIFKFNKKGNFIDSFGRQGQGPGEAQWPTSLRIYKNDEIAFTDSHHKFLIFTKHGNLIRETNIVSTFIGVVTPLDNGKYLIEKSLFDPQAEYIMQIPLILCNPEFGEVKELERYKYPNYITKRRFNGLVSDVIYSVSNGKIYVGNADRGYEICVYDLDGNLLRKIRKEYNPVKVPEEVKKNILERYEEPGFEDFKKKINFPDIMPPYKFFFTTDKGELFVMTYEKGKNPEEYIFDIYNPDGVFIDRKSLNSSLGRATVKQNSLYCLIEKESGYKKLIVYKIKWE